MIKPGRYVIDPLNRRVLVLEVTPAGVKVKLAGPYGATLLYPASCLRPTE